MVEIYMKKIYMKVNQQFLRKLTLNPVTAWTTDVHMYDISPSNYIATRQKKLAHIFLLQMNTHIQVQTHTYYKTHSDTHTLETVLPPLSALYHFIMKIPFHCFHSVTFTTNFERLSIILLDKILVFHLCQFLLV